MVGNRRGIAKGYTYETKNQAQCELCGRNFKTRSGLAGHMRFFHGLSDEPSSAPPLEGSPAPSPPPDEAVGLGAMPPAASNKALRAELERVRLTGELRKFGITPPPQSPIEQLREAQSLLRDLGKEQSDGSPLKRLADDAQALDLIRGSRQQGDGVAGQVKGILTALALVGIGATEIKQFALRLFQPPPLSGEAMKIGSIVIPAGQPMSDALWAKIVEFHDHERGLEYQKNKDAMLGEGLASLGRIISESNLLDKFGGTAGVDRRPQPEKTVLTCEKCGYKNLLDLSSIQHGESVACAGSLPDGSPCDNTWIAAGKPDSKRREPRVQKAPLPEDSGIPDVVECECGQQILVPEGTEVGDWLPCPVCGGASVVRSDIPVMPAQPEVQGDGGA